MDEEFYAVVKLKNGEEFFSQVCLTEEDDTEVLLLYHPITLTLVRTKKGFDYLVQPWIKIGNESLYVLNKEDILTMSELEDIDLIQMHTKYVTSKEQTNFHQENLSPSLGHIGTVSEAKNKLERIFENS